MANDLEQRNVLVAVGVEKAFSEVDAAGGGDLASHQSLSFSVARGSQHLSGEPAVDHLQPRAEDMRDLQIARQRIDLVARRRGNDG